METNLQDVLEALLFSSSGPLSVRQVQSVLERAADDGLYADARQGELAGLVEQLPTSVPAGRIREAVEALRERFDRLKSVYEIVEVPDGWKLVLRPPFAPWVRLLREEPSPKRLPASFMETLAVVAYRQPVTRAEIEAVRGVSCDRAITRLAELDMVRATGRADLPGRPIQYGTTDHFLEFCGITSLEQLPVSDIISTEMLGDWLKKPE
ncbi:MAG TPA: SMC-Scp complex subunit ScpB [Opitutales bacterium]|nr:SMC-Scp complex subunit ScpB [Opitutales bacterium]